MQTLGLFTVTRSLGFRTLLALLAGCLALRLIEGGDRLLQKRYRVLSAPDAAPPLFQADRWPWGSLFPVLAHSGALLLLTGLLITHLWGWRVEGLIVQSGEEAALPDAEKWVALDEDIHEITHSPGLVTFVEEYGPGVKVRATDGAGASLSLQQPAGAALATELTIPLAEDQYLSIPEAQLIVRLSPQPDRVIEAHSPVLIQVYRSPPGHLMTESVVEGDAELAVDEVKLELSSAPYARVTATFNPGRWPTGLGLALLGTGIVGSLVWPARRFWLTEEGDEVKGSGDVSAIPAQGKGA